MSRDKAQPLLAQQQAEAEAVAAAATAAVVAEPASGRAAPAPADREAGSSSWEAFHQQHASGRFFRPKRYLTAEFEQLAAPGIHILDIGAGNGASVVPVLATNASARATCCDISSTALRLLQASAGELPCGGIRLDVPSTCLLGLFVPPDVLVLLDSSVSSLTTFTLFVQTMLASPMTG
jgi:methylase of polypeptide subunit release factors